MQIIFKNQIMKRAWEEDRNGITAKQKMNKMTKLSPPPSIITWNINGLNSSIKRHRVTEWI